MSAGLLTVAITFIYIPIDTATLELQQTTVSTPAIVVLVFIVIFCHLLRSFSRQYGMDEH
jgi:SP family myo-inositol transporter-like MFS transporter 13